MGGITMDCDDLEQVRFVALGGADFITVNDLSGTDVTQVDVDLADVAGSETGDSQADTVIVNGTQGNDVALVVGAASTGANVLGLSAFVNVLGSEPALDRLALNVWLVMTSWASSLEAGAISLTADGGAGDDVLIGSEGADVLIGGDGTTCFWADPAWTFLTAVRRNIVIQD
jgi:hypothetical protein